MKTGNKLVIFLVKPIKTINIPVQPGPDYKIKNKPCNSHIVRSGRKPFLISRIIASETEKKLVIFLAKPIKTMSIPVPSPPISN